MTGCYCPARRGGHNAKPAPDCGAAAGLSVNRPKGPSFGGDLPRAATDALPCPRYLPEPYRFWSHATVCRWSMIQRPIRRAETRPEICRQSSPTYGIRRTSPRSGRLPNAGGIWPRLRRMVPQPCPAINAEALPDSPRSSSPATGYPGGSIGYRCHARMPSCWHFCMSFVQSNCISPYRLAVMPK